MTSPIHQGLALHQAGKLREAEQVYRQILARKPDDPDAMHLLGVIATQTRQFDAARRLIESAIRVRSDVVYYHNNLGNVHRAVGDLGAAEACYCRALTIQPNYADALVNLGTVLREMARFEDAVTVYERATLLSPPLTEAWSNLGTALMDQGRIDESLAAYRRAIALDPTSVDPHSNLVYVMHNSDTVTRDELFAEHLRWGERHAAPLASGVTAHANDREPGRPLRIGYVSPDFRDHPVARFLWPIVEHRDRGQFQVICFSSVTKPDPVTARYRSAVDEWHEIAAVDDAAAAELIRVRSIDILIDLAGHTNDSRLLIFARKPAPVQISFLGYPDTIGMPAIDLRITDELSDPSPEADARHVEALARVDGCFLCYPLADNLPAVGRSPAGDNGFVTFGSFNNLAKISPMTVRLWSQVLAAVPGSQLLIKTTRFGDEGTRSRAVKRCRGWGLPMNRVQLIGPGRTQAEHLQQYGRVDIALDTFPYNGTTTTCEALAMGAPVVTLSGDHHAARVGLSLLTAAGHPEWATSEQKRFVEIAASLAADVSQLASIRATLREQMRRSVLCDGAAYTRKIERIYRDAWVRWCRR